MLSLKMQFLANISPLQVVRFEKFQEKGSHFLNEHFEYPNSYVIFKNAVFTPYLLSK